MFENFQSDLSSMFWDNEYLYHFTLEWNVDSIKEEGLIPRAEPNSFYKDGCEGVFLTDRQEADRANLPSSIWDEVEQSNGEYPVITRLKISTKGLDFNQFYPDDDHKLISDKGVNKESEVISSLQNGWGLCYKGNISPNNIVEITSISF